MFSKELENLIQATLEDGILEDYEKAALVKRAQNEGVDLDELEIYINSLLQKRKRELSEKKEAEYSQIEKEKKTALGKVCPKCGKQIPSLTLVCECGFEFDNRSDKKSSIANLQEKLDAILGNDDPMFLPITAKKCEIIAMYPVPTVKEDIIDFLSTSLALSRFEGNKVKDILSSIPVWGQTIGADYRKKKKISRAWKEKFEQVLLKGRSLRGDAEFTQQLDYYERQLNRK